MSLQNILLNTNPNQQGLYDAQLHSCQIYKTPVLPTDAVPLDYSLATPPLPPFDAVYVVGLQGIDPTTNYKYRVTQQGGYIYPQSEWNCMVVGFQNENKDNVANVFPSRTNENDINDGTWYVGSSRSLSNNLPGYDYIWCLMSRKIYELRV